MSQGYENIEFSQEQNLKRAFHHWDAGLPADSVWDAIEEDLVIENTWLKLDEELSLERVWVKLDDELPHTPNTSLSASFEDWEPSMNGSGWAKLDEELSRERVWFRLRNSLNNPVSVHLPILKMVAATLLFISIAFNANYDLHQRNYSNRFESEKNVDNWLTINSLEDSKSTSVTFDTDKKANQDVVNQALVVEPEMTQNESNYLVDKTRNENSKYLNTNAEQEHVDNSQTLSSTDLNFNLEKRQVFNEEEFFQSLYKHPKVILRPKWSFGFGSQLAIINEEKRSVLTSTLPRFGFAADAQYNLYFKDFRWSNGIGFAQYKQENGRYTNGRYLQSNQNLNTLYLSSSIGYSVKRFTFFSGIMVNKLLNGYEGTKSVTTNVYNSKHLQVGGRVGIDYNFKPFKNNTCLGLSMQYQFVPSLKSMNQTFNDIHGIGMQVKFSF